MKHSHKIPLVFALVVAACPAFAAATNTLHDKTAKGSPTTADETYLWDVTDNTLKKATLGTLPVSTPQQASLDDKANTSCFVDASAFNACFGLDWATGGTFDQAGNYTLTGSWDFTGATVTGVSGGSMVYPGAGISVSTGSAWGVSLALDTDLSSVSASDDSVPSAKATKAALDALPSIIFGTGITVAEDTPSTGSDTISVTPNTYQAYDADWLGVTANGASLISAANYAAMRTLLDLEVGTDFNAFDADLTTWAGVTPGTGVATFIATPSGANLASALTSALPASKGGTGLTAIGTGVGTALGNNTGAVGGLPTIIASGAYTVDTASINANTCASAVAVTASGVATTDIIIATPSAILSSVTGFGVTTAGAVRVDIYPTSGNVNFQFCNPTGAAIDPGSVTFNWKVIR